MARPSLFPVGCVLMLAGIPAAQAQDSWSEWTVSSGIDFSSGSYGAEEDTDILYVPLTTRYETSRFQVRVTVPYLRIKGPGSVLGGADGGVVVGPGSNEVVTQDGLGDVVVSGTYNLYPDGDSGLPFVELTAKVKLPTADEDKGLGTGKTDVTLQVDAFQSFGQASVFATAGYRFRGSPEGFNLNDQILLSGGVSYKLDEKVSFGGIIDWREAAVTGIDDQFEIVPYIVFNVAERWSLNTYAVIGLSDTSPDYGIGAQLSRSF